MGSAQEKFRATLKLSVYRSEKKNDAGELVQEKGWKPVGRGQLRLMHDDGVHFLEFRPEVSEGGRQVSHRPIPPSPPHLRPTCHTPRFFHIREFFSFHKQC